MALFDPAIEKTLLFEGGYVNNPNDPGGATNFGITLPALQGIGSLGDIDGDGDVDTADIKVMSVNDAKQVYKKLYWNGDALRSQAIAEKHFDMGVNMGTATASKFLQQAAVLCESVLVVDGKLGPNSIKTINNLNEVKLMTALCEVQSNFYWSIVKKDIEKNASSWNWPLELVKLLLAAIAAKDTLACQTHLRTLQSLKLKPGKLCFLKGWLKRAACRFDI